VREGASFIPGHCQTAESMRRMLKASERLPDNDKATPAERSLASDLEGNEDCKLSSDVDGVGVFTEDDAAT
jgi:hypothetical protein